VFENKDKIVLVMQYASGGELYEYVSYHKMLTDSDARRIFRQVATAIYYCHKVSIPSPQACQNRHKTLPQTNYFSPFLSATNFWGVLTLFIEQNLSP